MTAYQCEDYVVTCDGCGAELRINAVLVHFESSRSAQNTWQFGWAANGDEHRCPSCQPSERDASDIYHSRLENRSS